MAETFGPIICPSRGAWPRFVASVINPISAVLAVARDPGIVLTFPYREYVIYPVCWLTLGRFIH